MMQTYPERALPRRRRIDPMLFVHFGIWLVVSLTIVVFVWASRSDVVHHLAPGDVAPGFQLYDQVGYPHKLDDYQNRPVVLIFMPDLAETSIAELCSLKRKITEFDGLEVKIFAIVPGGVTTTQSVLHVHQSNHLPFPILVDTDKRVSREYGADTGSEGYRRISYVIGSDGRILMPVTAVATAAHGQQLLELTACCLDTQPQRPSRLIGQPIAPFTLPSVTTGKPESLYEDGKQKVTVFLFLSAECPCSGGYDARLCELANIYSKKGVRFLAINSSANETVKEIETKVAKAGYPFPVLKDVDNIIADQVQAQVTPEAYVVDATGILRYHGRIDDNRIPENVTSHDLRNALDLLLAGKLPTRADVPTFGCAIYRSQHAVPTAPPSRLSSLRRSQSATIDASSTTIPASR